MGQIWETGGTPGPAGAPGSGLYDATADDQGGVVVPALADWDDATVALPGAVGECYAELRETAPHQIIGVQGRRNIAGAVQADGLRQMGRVYMLPAGGIAHLFRLRVYRSGGMAGGGANIPAYQGCLSQLTAGLAYIDGQTALSPRYGLEIFWNFGTQDDQVILGRVNSPTWNGVSAQTNLWNWGQVPGALDIYMVRTLGQLLWFVGHGENDVRLLDIQAGVGNAACAVAIRQENLAIVAAPAEYLNMDLLAHRMLSIAALPFPLT